jgi:DNA primase
VALGGTSLAPAQVQAIVAAKLEQVILALDNDPPGQKGIATMVERLRPSGLQIFVARLPGGVKDPNELVRKHGPAAFIQACNDAEDWARWKARSLVAPFDLSTDRGRDAALSQTLSYYATIEDGIYRRTFREELTLATQLTEAELENRAQVYAAQAMQQQTATLLRDLARRLQGHIADNDLTGAELALRQCLGHLQQSRGAVPP